MKCTIIGNLTKDCEVKQIGDRTLLKLSIAENYNKGSEKQTNYWNCDYFVKTDRIAEFLVKGTKVVVFGDCHQQKVDEKVYYNVNVSSLEFVGIRSENSATPSAKNTVPPPADFAPASDDSDLPF